ncbi:MAG TPA: HD domain-containing protein [Candidatus Paceibacterota bacterium]|nr:HD domain-containing protein [Candidatus Paceibacterota bacterium]
MPGKFYKKYIRIPPNESIDIRRISPIIHHPLFQRLLHISQLGTTLAVFPGATHNRFEHSLGVYAKTLKFCDKMREEGFLTVKEAANVSIFALMHDIGHGPFSHVIEGLTPQSGDENENGIKVLAKMKDAVVKSGGDFNFIKDLFSHKNPLYKIVMDKNVGMDKLDYLERDVYHTGFGQRPDIESIFNYLVYLKGELVVDKKSLEAAKQMQRLYLYMYKEVYLHKSSLISQRFLEKMLAMWLKTSSVKPEELWLMNDKELIGEIYKAPDDGIQLLYQCYRNRNFPRTGLVLRLDHKQFRERIAGKAIKVIGERKEFFEQFLKHSSPQALEKVEADIAELVGVPGYKIVVVPTLTPWRFAPKDILYHDDGKVFSLKKTQKRYFDVLREEMSDYLALRVCIIGDRKLVYNNAGKIHKLLKKIT